MTRSRELHVFLRGGLGNQLFQYSTGLAISRAQGRELVIRGDLLPEVEDSIGGVSRWPSQISDFNHSGRSETKSHQPQGRTNLFGKGMQSMRLLGDLSPALVANFGWLASEAVGSSGQVLGTPTRLVNSYSPFKDLAFSNRKTLRGEISAVRDPSQDFLHLVKEIKNSQAVAVHLRQGDYLQLGHIYGSSSLDFLKSALRELRRSREVKNTWLFTDTPSSIPEDVLRLLAPERVIGPEVLQRPIENMNLMSQACGLIAANSSFSWWAAFLAPEETRVIAPKITSARVNNFSAESEVDSNWKILSVN